MSNYKLRDLPGSGTFLMLDVDDNVYKGDAISEVLAANGLNVSADTTLLGGTLIQSTSIDTDINSFLFTSAARNGTDSVLQVTNNGTGGCIYANSIGNTAISGYSTNANGGYFRSDSNTAITNYSTSATPCLVAENRHSATNTLIDVALLRHTVTFPTLPANGIATGIAFSNGRLDAGGAQDFSTITGRIYNRMTSVADATLLSEMVIQCKDGAAETDVLSVDGNGIVKILLGLQDFVNDAAAAAGGIPVTGLYRNGSVVMIRVV